MKHLYFAIPLILLSIYSFSDDTEIYGTAGNTNANQAKPNVLFIMDTSGSMDANVISRPNYDPTVDYEGSYSDNRIYSGLNQYTWQGHVKTALEHSTDSVDCEGVVTTLGISGKVNGNFQQYHSSGWQVWLQNGDNGNIRCNGDAISNAWIYTGNYMNWFINWSANGATNTNKDRLDTVIDVVKNITASISDVNMGLMRFDTGSGGSDSSYAGGMVDVAVVDITTSRSQIDDKLDDYNHQGGTPLTEVMYEAGRYFRGETPEYGDSSYPNHSVSASKTGSTYDSPITAQCQKNHIILFTDGEPTVDGQADDHIHDLIADMDFSLVPELNKDCRDETDLGGDKIYGACLDELAYWLNQTDHSDDFSESQPIITYTIGGFDLDSATQLLSSTAAHGGGSFYQANNTAGLTNVLTEIFTEILAVDTTFTAPAVSVNAFNSSEHRDDLFYALFRPENNVKWGGNLKRYKIQDGEVKGYELNADLVTKDLSDAIDPSTGYFHLDSFDLWNATSVPDGKNVTNGGMANLLPTSTSRNIYSNRINATASLPNEPDTLHDFDTIASHTSFNMSSDEYDSSQILSWVKGKDVNDEDTNGNSEENRNSIGDPLHSEPVIVTYGGTEDEPDSTIYFGTNEGFIHGINTETGVEQLAFLPYELHDIQESYYENTASVANKEYGMDGPVSAWLQDHNDNNVLYSNDATPVLDSGEKVFLYAGMRRGGQSYYGLDVTDRANPEMLFRITGGAGGTPGFEQLGQTWSKMTIEKVRWNNTSDDDAYKHVLFFTGGYDTNQDSNDTRESDDIGNAIYMVDATTGELLWSASESSGDLLVADMKNSIPASITPVDISGDGFVDYFFAADTGGRIFRFDLNSINTGADTFASAEVIAQVGDGTEAGNLRFYNKPSVALIKDKTYGDYLTISIGSGYRAHPLNKIVEDRFFMIKDRIPYPLDDENSICDIATGLDTDCPRTTITEASDSLISPAGTIDTLKLYNVTSATTSGVISSGLKSLLANGSGWYVKLSEGEKVLSQATTFAGAVLFTTFSPVTTASSSASSCGANTGTSRAYAIGQKWGLPVLDLDGDGTLDASITLAHSGIAPRPVVIYGPSGTKTITVGTETINDERFGQGSNSEEPDCEEGEDCSCVGDDCPCEGPDCPEPACSDGNCFVTPVYWRQFDNE